MHAGIGCLEDGQGDSVTETGLIASSRFCHKFTNALQTRVRSLTKDNDSRVIHSDNKLGVAMV